MTYHLDIQHASTTPCPISDEILYQWVELALKPHRSSAELTLRCVDASEIQALNHQYRKKNSVTNVLAFPSSLPEGIVLDLPFLGDVIICVDVLNNESVEQQKDLMDHWAHLVIHGVLHLLGYDHITDTEAAMMQSIEIQTLALLGIDNPYDTEG